MLCKANLERSKRLNKVIDYLENQQNKNYNTNFEFVLSYLRDIRDGSVPDYVMRGKRK